MKTRKQKEFSIIIGGIAALIMGLSILFAVYNHVSNAPQEPERPEVFRFIEYK